jgi:hypothetical protein
MQPVCLMHVAAASTATTALAALLKPRKFSTARQHVHWIDSRARNLTAMRGRGVHMHGSASVQRHSAVEEAFPLVAERRRMALYAGASGMHEGYGRNMPGE